MDNFIKEILAIQFLKKNGYSIIEVTGNDGNVKVYFKKVNGVKKIKIKNKTFIINKSKMHRIGGMPLYRFYVNTAVGTGLDGKTTQTGKKDGAVDVDSDILTEIIEYASMLGEKTVVGDKKTQIIYLVIGAIIGVLAGTLLAMSGII